MAGAKMAGVKIFGAFLHQNRKNRSLCGCRKHLVRKKNSIFSHQPRILFSHQKAIAGAKKPQCASTPHITGQTLQYHPNKVILLTIHNVDD
jgi:hypothetical protein